MVIEYNPSIFVNFLAFFGLSIATYTIFYFGRSTGPKGIGLNIFTLALGINLIGLSHLFRIWLDPGTSPIVLITVGTGSVLLSSGVLTVFQQKNNEVSSLKKRQEEIKSIISKLKDKYYQQELSEEDLKSAYSELLKELAEIEVKMDSKEIKS
ncbi:MAG: hypothetical protein HYW23_03025 [Candidatus Aenigmarchaeota archaeon]|nr:hypothetical protein [Candidatus Aenigmarchaeota archaeon]